MGLIITSARESFRFAENLRDSCILWSGIPFIMEGYEFGRFLIEPSKLDVVYGFDTGCSWNRLHSELLSHAEILHDKLVEDSDLLKYNYFYSFSGRHPIFKDSKTPRGGGVSGFKIDGYSASIDATSKPFLTLELTESAPSGRGRIVQYIDMRNRKSYRTDECGELRRHRRKGKFELLSHVGQLIEFLERNRDDVVTITPEWQRKPRK